MDNMPYGIFTNVRNRDLQKEYPETEDFQYTETSLALSQNLVKMAMNIKEYDCDVQEKFFELFEVPAQDFNKATEAFTEAKQTADMARVGSLQQMPPMPKYKLVTVPVTEQPTQAVNPIVSAMSSPNSPPPSAGGGGVEVLLPGWKEPTRLLPPLVHVDNPTLKKRTQLGFLDLLSKILCGYFDFTINIPSPPPLCDPKIPPFDIDWDLNITIDPCLAKFLPPMFEPSNIKKELKFWGDKATKTFGKIPSVLSTSPDSAPSLGPVGELANAVKDTALAAAGAVGEAVSAVSSALDSVMGGSAEQNEFGFSGMGDFSTLADIGATVADAAKNVADAAKPLLGAVAVAGAVAGGSASFTGSIIKSIKSGGVDIKNCKDLLGIAENGLQASLGASINIDSGLSNGGNMADLIPDGVKSSLNNALDKVGAAKSKVDKMMDALDAIMKGKVPC